MPNVVFVAPYFLPTTVRFVQGTAALPGVRLGLVSSDPLARLPAGLRARVAAHRALPDCFDPQAMADAVRALAGEMGGPVHRLLGALEQLQEPLGEVRDALGIPGMSAEVARNFRDKARMKTLLREAGLPCARHRLVEGEDETRTFAAEVGYPLVVKPPAGAGAKATFRVDDDRQLGEGLAMSRPAPRNPWLLEEFIRGEERSFDTISIAGQPVWHSGVEYLPTPLEVLRNPWIQWCVLLPRDMDDPAFTAIHPLGTRALQVLGMGTGLTHMEWFRRPDGSLAISEVAARPPGAQITTLISWAHDWDFAVAWARVMVYGELEPPPRRFAAGAAFLRGQGEGRVARIHGLGQAQRELGPLVVETHLPRPGQPRASSYEGEGVVILRHPDTEVVRRGLMRLVTLVRVEMG